jgi:heme/copper-type cytochrome/quinol oxidase subunit 2
MRREQIVPYTGVTVIVSAALALVTIVARSPDTHGHFWHSVPATYTRTQVGAIAPADLPAILANLPPFGFPAPDKVGAAASHAGHTMANMGSAAPAQSETGEQTDIQKITLTEREYGIEPTRLTLKMGVRVELTVVNHGKQVHGIWMPEFGIAEDIRSGKTKVFRFTPDKPGRFRYVCSYSLCGTEEQHGKMVGFLIIQP